MAEADAVMALEVYTRNHDHHGAATEEEDLVVYAEDDDGVETTTTITTTAAAALPAAASLDDRREEEINELHAGVDEVEDDNGDGGQPEEEEDSSSAANANKWHQNGYGDVVPKQSGKFSREESDIIKAAIEDYCARKNTSVKALCSEREHKANLKGAWMEIAKKLPDRSVQSVYRHGIRQCHPFKRGAWSEAEVSMLHDLVAHNSKKWSMIQTKLNRSADSCRDKVWLYLFSRCLWVVESVFFLLPLLLLLLTFYLDLPQFSCYIHLSIDRSVPRNE
jgi:Myb-like DNA-binding domain